MTNLTPATKRLDELETINSTILTKIKNNEILFENNEVHFRMSASSGAPAYVGFTDDPVTGSFCINASDWGLRATIHNKTITFQNVKDSTIQGSITLNAAPKIITRTFNGKTYHYLILPNIANIEISFTLTTRGMGNIASIPVLEALKSNMKLIFPNIAINEKFSMKIKLGKYEGTGVLSSNGLDRGKDPKYNARFTFNGISYGSIIWDDIHRNNVHIWKTKETQNGSGVYQHTGTTTGGSAQTVFTFPNLLVEHIIGDQDLFLKLNFFCEEDVFRDFKITQYDTVDLCI